MGRWEVFRATRCPGCGWPDPGLTKAGKLRRHRPWAANDNASPICPATGQRPDEYRPSR